MSEVKTLKLALRFQVLDNPNEVMIQVKTCKACVSAEALNRVNLVEREDQRLQVYKLVEGLDLADAVVE